MDSKTEENLIERTVAEQDVLIYYMYNYFEEQLFATKIAEDFKVNYSQLDKEVIAKNLDKLPQFSMNNLLYLLKSGDKTVRESAIIEIMKKFEAGEHVFSGENAQSSSFGLVTNVWDDPFRYLGKDNIEKVISSINERFDKCEQENPKAFEVVSKFAPYAAIDNFFWAYDNGIITDEKLDFINELVSENPNILSTLNFGIFSDNILDMGKDFVSKLAKYPNTSNIFIRLSKTNPELFEMVKSNFKELEATKTVQEASEIEYKTLRYVGRKAFQIGKDVDFETLQNCALRSQGNPCIELDYCEDYERKYQELCDKKYKTAYLNKKREILCDKYFGMSALQVKNFYINYIKNISQIGEQSPKLQELVANINRYMSAETEEDLDKLYESIETVITPLEKVAFEYNLREQYTQTIADSLQETHKKIENAQKAEYIEYNGKKIEQIRVNGNFNLLVHSTDSGFKEDKEILNGDFKKTWRQQKNPSAHLVSSCYINQDFLGHIPAGNNGVLAVFSDVETKDLSLMGPTDINSHIVNYDYQAGNSMYMTAENLPYNSRKVYNEVPVERQDPKYFLIFDDTPEEVLQNTYKAVSDFGGKLLYIDKREIVKNQLENLDNLTNQFRETGDLSVLQNLICSYETNVAGWLLNRDTSESDESLTQNINNERFRVDFETRENAIYSSVVSYVKDIYGTEGYENKLQQMSDIMQSEIDKYEMTDLEKTPISDVKMKFNASGIKEKLDTLLQTKDEQTVQPENKVIDLSKFIESFMLAGKGIGMRDIYNIAKLKEKSEKMQEGQEYGA